MRNEYEKELWEIHEWFIKLADRVSNMLNNSKECLKEWNKTKSYQIIKEDLQVNDLQRKLEQLSFELIMKQQPVASDYRFLSAVVKFTADYERIGDQSKDICEIIVSSENPLDEKLVDLLEKMYDEVRYMLEGATDSIDLQDEELGNQIAAHDDVVDRLYLEVREYCIEAIKENAIPESSIIDGLQIGKYLERIGDHCENIAEWSSYVKSGVYPE